GAGAAQPDGEKLREIDGKSREKTELEETHDGAHPDIRFAIEEAEVPESNEKRADKSGGKGGFASVTLGGFRESEHAEKSAEILDDHVYAGPDGLLPRNAFGIHSLLPK